MQMQLFLNVNVYLNYARFGTMNIEGLICSYLYVQELEIKFNKWTW